MSVYLVNPLPGRHRDGRSVEDTIVLVFMRDPAVRAACLDTFAWLCSCLLIDPPDPGWYDDTLADLEAGAS